jgi:hypothetical protein
LACRFRGILFDFWYFIFCFLSPGLFLFQLFGFLVRYFHGILVDLFFIYFRSHSFFGMQIPVITVIWGCGMLATLAHLKVKLYFLDKNLFII